eukprot:TRINITY_DN5394_c0_g1_i1.p1 TRINITY_DN5394_c0_g1~~TRINITY_DN5394_c0_g1_i1.p1  ORF type:complete len:234 (-),score=49.85 TRINITY_DN5394_c0_g1_i1:14-715(-)
MEQKISFFVELNNSNKRSFQLRSSQINANKLSLMSTVAEKLIYIIIGEEKIYPENDGSFNYNFLPDKEYQIAKKSIESNKKWIKFCEFETVKKERKIRGPAGGRDITVFYHKEELFAMDSVCYHLGGPLDIGDIEEYGGKSCVVCPWHRYKIDLKSGEALYSKLGGEVCSKGKKQRVHTLKIENNSVLVKLDLTPEKIESDTYAFNGLYLHPVDKNPPKKNVHSKITDVRKDN